jgi:hypothetical protein
MGLLNELDQWVVEPLYRFLGDFTSQGRPVEYTRAHSAEGLWGLINLSGEWVAPPDHQFCDYRSDGLMAVKERDGRSWGYYTLDGEARVPLGYDRRAEFGAPSRALQDRP